MTNATPEETDQAGQAGQADALDEAVDALSDRLRALPESALRRGAAASGLALARELARRARALERAGSGAPAEVPDIGIYAVGDQVAVTGHDLAHTLRQAPPAPATRHELADALRLIRSVRA